MGKKFYIFCKKFLKNSQKFFKQREADTTDLVSSKICNEFFRTEYIYKKWHRNFDGVKSVKHIHAFLHILPNIIIRCNNFKFDRIL